MSKKTIKEIDYANYQNFKLDERTRKRYFLGEWPVCEEHQFKNGECKQCGFKESDKK